jgi:hypothetical protein
MPWKCVGGGWGIAPLFLTVGLDMNKIIPLPLYLRRNRPTLPIGQEPVRTPLSRERSCPYLESSRGRPVLSSVLHSFTTVPTYYVECYCYTKFTALQSHYKLQLHLQPFDLPHAITISFSPDLIQQAVLVSTTKSLLSPFLSILPV